METTDYKSLYKSIPIGYRNEVWKIVGCDKNMLSRWQNGGSVHPKKVSLIEETVKKISKPHNLIKDLTVTPKRIIVIDRLTETIYLEYTELMEFQVKITGTIGDAETKHELIHSAREEYEQLFENDPYSFKLLIAKWILK